MFAVTKRTRSVHLVYKMGKNKRSPAHTTQGKNSFSTHNSTITQVAEREKLLKLNGHLKADHQNLLPPPHRRFNKQENYIPTRYVKQPVGGNKIVQSACGSLCFALCAVQPMRCDRKY